MSYPKNLTELYSGVDLDTLFKGNFINFGYWKNIPNIISTADVIEANTQLYYQIFQRLKFKEQDKVLEVGSGRGRGCSLLCSSHPIQSIVGLDCLITHIECSVRAYSYLIEAKKIKFLQGRAESIPLPDASIDKIYTIEAFQHFKARCAISEFSRVLSPGGKLIITTFFANHTIYFNELLTLLPRPAILDDNNEELVALPEILNLLKTYSFKNVFVENISKYVWPGYDIWVRQNDPNIWDKNWMIAYAKGLIDYYIITADLKK
jgi:ubiquinone/menaquinone biosynthesis C-methylase UbiE